MGTSSGGQFGLVPRLAGSLIEHTAGNRGIRQILGSCPGHSLRPQQGSETYRFFSGFSLLHFWLKAALVVTVSPALCPQKPSANTATDSVYLHPHFCILFRKAFYVEARPTLSQGERKCASSHWPWGDGWAVGQTAQTCRGLQVFASCCFLLAGTANTTAIWICNNREYGTQRLNSELGSLVF